MPTETNIPASKLKRSALTGIMAAKIGVKHAGYKARSLLTKPKNEQASKLRHEEEIGDIIFSVLTKLRGTALKVSQILSMEADILPIPIREKLKAACHQVPPINRALVRKQFVQEFEKSPNDLFLQFDSQAFAAASIGQVHRAITIAGESVAVKVQYPGISSTIESDLKIIETLFSALSKTSDLLPQTSVLSIMMTEMQDRLREEVNYHVEADNVKWFKENVKLAGVTIPDVIDELSSKRILTLEMLEGLHISEWLATKPSQQQKNQVGQKLFDYFWFCAFELRRINADLHPGNFLILKDGSLGAIDFGCVRTLGQDFISTFVNLIPALVDTLHNGRNSEQLLKVYQSLKVISEEVTLDQFESEIQPSIEPFGRWLCEAYVTAEFDFRTKQPCPGRPSEDSRTLVKFLSGFHHEQLCFDRAHLGLMNLLTEIGAVVKTDWMQFHKTK